jgi:hypothetical protein
VEHPARDREVPAPVPTQIAGQGVEAQ